MLSNWIIVNKRHRGVCSVRKFGERLRDEREKIKMSQNEFGKKCGVTKLTQFRYEKSKRSPNIEYWQALHDLGIDIVYIITGKKK